MTVAFMKPNEVVKMMWQPLASRSPLSQGDSVKKLLFTFYDGQLFRMVVTYEPDRTAGMTADDMIASVSAMFG